MFKHSFNVFVLFVFIALTSLVGCFPTVPRPVYKPSVTKQAQFEVPADSMVKLTCTDPSEVPAIAKAMSEAYLDKRIIRYDNLLQCLNDIGGTAAIKALCKAALNGTTEAGTNALRERADKAVPMLVNELAGNYQYVFEVYELAARIGGAHAAQVFERILRDENAEVERRGFAATYFGKVATSHPQAQLLTEVLENDTEFFVRLYAATGLGYMARRAKAGKTKISVAELNALANGLLIRVIQNDTSREVRLSAVWALGDFGNPLSRPILERVLTEKGGDGMRDAAACSLGSVADSVSDGLRKAWLKQVPATDSDLNWCAAKSIGMIDGPATLLPLQEALPPEDTARRLQIIEILEEFHLSALPVLEEWLKKESQPEIRRVIKMAIQSIKDKEYFIPSGS